MAIVEDRRSRVPFAMHDRLSVPRERYFSREFFDLEKELLWPRIWQMACRLEEIPAAGDFVEYEICDDSVLVVRQPDRSVRAFHNTCRHRATQLCKGTGRLGSGQIVCPFHGWRWNVDGSNSFVYGADGFDRACLAADDIRLREVRVDTWGSCVWVNLDPEARPLLDALSPGAALLDGVGFGNMRVWWWKEAVINANWKVAQEAFLEGWHVMQTHPQLTQGRGTDYPAAGAAYTSFENGHARFQGRERPSVAGGVATTGPDQFIARSRTLWEGQDAMTLERDLHVFRGVRNRVGPDEEFGPCAIAALYEYAEGAGIPVTTTPEGMRLWGGEVFLFPNYLVLPMFFNAEVYRVRPYDDDPEWCRFEVWSLTTYPEDEEPGRAELQGRYPLDDTEHWGLIPRQDFGNIERQQRGLHSRSYAAHRLATEWESGIANMHQELDRYLAG